MHPGLPWRGCSKPTVCCLINLDAVIRRAAPQGKIRTYSHLFFAALNGILLSYARFPDRAGDEALAHMRELAALLAGLFEKNKRTVHASSAENEIVLTIYEFKNVICDIVCRPCPIKLCPGY